MPIENSFVAAYLLLLLGGGLACFIHFLFFSHESKRIDPAASVPGWNLNIPNFVIGVISIIVVVILVQIVAVGLAPTEWLIADTPEQIVFLGFATHLAALLGVVILYKSYRDKFQEPFVKRKRSWPEAAGIAFYTFLVLIPIIFPITYGWNWILETFDIEADAQDSVILFAQIDTPLLLILMIVLTVVVAPISEEIIFRGGLYRFLKARTGLIAALVANGLLFSLVHKNLFSFVPLAILGIALAYVYERSGDIKTPILLHGIFNLNTVIIILASGGLMT